MFNGVNMSLSQPCYHCFMKIALGIAHELNQILGTKIKATVEGDEIWV